MKCPGETRTIKFREGDMFNSRDGFFIAEWESCTDREKAEIIAEFLQENENGIGWEGWYGFLLDKFCIMGNSKPVIKGMAGSS